MDGSLMMGDRDSLAFEDMRPEEYAIVKALEAARASGQDVMRIAEIMSAAGWDEVDEHECGDGVCRTCSAALREGNSKVRNNLRRLMRYGWIHRPVDGSYALVTKEAAVEPAPAKPEQSWRLVTIRRNPKQLTEEEARALRVSVMALNFKPIDAARKLDCSFYNACLSQADSGKWAGFACTNCTAYNPETDHFQMELDVLGLRAVQRASEMLDEYGKVNRIRGVKPGPDAKRGPAVDDDEDDEFADAY